VRAAAGTGYKNTSMGFIKELKSNFPLFIMLLPGVIVLLINNYIPMFGVIIAFKRYRFIDNFFTSLIKSDWVGFKNFEFFFKTPYAFQTTRNTILYNLAFILLDLLIPVFFAIALSEIKSKKLSKTYQSLCSFRIFYPG
jgi:putative aldouronate transport system permease protein